MRELSMTSSPAMSSTPRTQSIEARRAAVWLMAAASFFWLSWALMPGVGITDAMRILTLVGQKRESVRMSVVLQLTSAACYAPALVFLVLHARARLTEHGRLFTRAAIVMLVGAMGSAADAVFHWLAVEMTAPGVAQDAMLPVMARMQGPALIAVAPLIFAFFLGTGMLVHAFVRAGYVHKGIVGLGLAALPVLALAPVLPDHGRIVGLTFLGCIAAVQVWLGRALVTQSRS